jgi:hypothetical protein
MLRAQRTRAISQNSFLESEFCGELHWSRSGRADNVAEMGIIVHFSIYLCGSLELGMIEDVECLNPEFQRFRLSDSQQSRGVISKWLIPGHGKIAEAHSRNAQTSPW